MRALLAFVAVLAALTVGGVAAMWSQVHLDPPRPPAATSSEGTTR